MSYNWAIIGAGPAGIATVGKLLDAGVPPDSIIWIDPHFAVGDFGRLWRNVPSNTRVSLFLKFLSASAAFEYHTCTENFALHQAHPDKTCELNLMADALAWVTTQLRKKVLTLADKVTSISREENSWHITLEKNSVMHAKKIVLAIGAEPKKLSHTHSTMIPLHDALDKARLKQHCDENSTIAVFGSSHSAMLILQNLTSQGVKRIINFYRTPLCYAIYLDEGQILFDDTGLKGTTAEWVRANIDGVMPANLERIYSDENNLKQFLPHCDKVIYAVGFERRTLTINSASDHTYNKETGIIAPNLFGIGIAFPEGKYNSVGVYEHRVGLWKFMDYLQRILPVWLKHANE